MKKSNGSMVRFSVIMPEDLLKRLDGEAGHYKRSEYIAKVLRQFFEKESADLNERLAREKHKGSGRQYIEGELGLGT